MKRKVLSLTLTLSLLTSMFSMSFHVGIGAGAANASGGGSVSNSANIGATNHEIYWTRSVEYSPWLTETGDVSSNKLPNPVAANYDEAVSSLYRDGDGEYNNPYVLNLNSKENDLEDTLNDKRMQIAYVDPYFESLQSKANLSLTSEELSKYKSYYNRILEGVQASAKAYTDPAAEILTGTNENGESELAEYKALVEKRYRALTTAEAAILKLYEEDYNKAVDEKLTYSMKYIWDGGYCPVEDHGSSTEISQNVAPATPVDKYAGIPVYVTTAAPITDGQYLGVFAADTVNYYYIDANGNNEGYYDYVPVNAYVCYNNVYYKIVQQIEARHVAYYGDWAQDPSTADYAAAYLEEVTDETLIAGFEAPQPPAPQPVTGFTLTENELSLNIEKRGSGTYAGQISTYESAYVGLKSVTPDSNVSFSVSYTTENTDIISLGEMDDSDPYAIKVTALKAGEAQVICTVTSNGETFTKTISVLVTETVNDDIVDPQYGIYCRGLTGELGNNSTELRLGDTSAQGKWATWMAWVDEGHTYAGPIETVRRFTGYVYLSSADFKSGNTLYFSALDDILISGDDSFAIVVNGVPFVRAAIAPHNNYVNNDGKKFEDDMTVTVKTVSACGEGCSIASEEKQILYKYGGATTEGPWHAHLDTSTLFDATSYLKPGANRIDIITGDVAQGGGMSRIYLYSSETNPFKGDISVKVEAFTDPECTIPAIEVPVGTTVYYKYTVTNTGGETIYNAQVRDPVVGVTFSKDSYTHLGNTGPYGEKAYSNGVNGNITDTTPINQYSSLTPAEIQNLAQLSSIPAGGSVSLVITSQAGTNTGSSIIGTEKASVTNTVYAKADNLDEVRASALVTFVATGAIADDYVVIDYGLPVTVPVLDNDGLGSSTTAIVNVAKASEGIYQNTFGELTDEELSTVSEYDTQADGVYGTASVIDEAGKNATIKYTPTTIVNDIDTFIYSVNDKNSVATAKLTVVPASSVYYEDTFSSTIPEDPENLGAYLANGGLVYTGAWTTAGNTKTDMEQAYDNDAIYGYDGAYDVKASDSLYSGGSAHSFGTAEVSITEDGVKWTLSKAVKEKNYAMLNRLMKLAEFSNSQVAYMTFAFEGTGFDIFSRCTSDSGAMTVNVYNRSDVDSATFDANGKISGISPVKSIVMNNIKEGSSFAQEQVPTVTFKELPHNEYVVQVEVKNALVMGSNGSIIYIDAVRVYSPLSNTADADKIDEYYNNKEKASVTYKVRDLILNGTDEFNNNIGDYDNAGTVSSTGDNRVMYLPVSYITDDATIDLGDATSMAKFAKIGPKSELYLQNVGDGFVFGYDATNATAGSVTLQIDAKLIDKTSSGVQLKVTNLTTGKSMTKTIKSYTQMFYDFTEILGSSKTAQILVQKGSGANEVLSITNIKIPAVSGTAVLTAPENLSRPSTVTISGETEMYPNTVQMLSYTVAPEGALVLGTTWSVTEGAAYASVDAYGRVTINSGAPENTKVVVKVSVGTNAAGEEVYAQHTINVLKEPTYVQNITVSGNTSVQVGATVQLAADIMPEDATVKTVTWKSLDTDIATVDKNGLVTTKAIGTVTIQATAQDGSGVVGQTTVTVNPVSVTGITVAPDTASMTVGETLQLRANVLPENATNRIVTWSASSQDGGKVTIYNGSVTAVRHGTVTVRATTADGGHYAECVITIAKPAITSITIPQKASITAGAQLSISDITILPAAASYLKDEATIVIDDNTSGALTQTGTGIFGSDSVTEETGSKMAQVRVKIGDTYSNTAAITVTAEQSTFEQAIFRFVKPNEEYINGGGFVGTLQSANETTAYFGAEQSLQVGPVDIAESGSTYYISIPVANVAYNYNRPVLKADITRDGKIEYVKGCIRNNAFVPNVTDGGNEYNDTDFTISYFMLTDGGNGRKVPVFNVTLGNSGSNSTNVPINEVAIFINDNAASVDVPLNSTRTLSIKFVPSNASDKSVTWTSSNPTIARVDANGVVTGNVPGKAVITATSNHNKKTDTITVNVMDILLQSVAITSNIQNNTVYQGDSYQLGIRYTPADNSHKGVSWKISPQNSGVTIDQNGNLAVSADATTGSYTVTATSVYDEAIKDSVSFEVRALVQSANITLVNDGKNVRYYYGDAGTQPGGVSGLGTTTQTIAFGEEKVVCLTDKWNLDNSIKISLNKDGSLNYSACVRNSSWGTAPYWDDSNECYYDITFNAETNSFEISKRSDAAANSSGTVSQSGAAPVVPTAVAAITPDTADVTAGTAALSAAPDKGAFENCTFTWASSDAAVASFDTAGSAVLTLKKAGTTNITVTVSGGNLETELAKTITFTVTGPVLSLSTTAPDPVIFTNDSADNTISLTASYGSPVVPVVTWASNNDTIATVSEGVITAVGTGEAIITASDSYGNTQSYNVTVKQYVYPDITSLTAGMNTILVGGNTQLTANYMNEPVYGIYDVRDVSVTWSITSGSEYASVDATGIVTGIAAGVATVTAVNKAGDTATIDITVDAANPTETATITLIKGSYASYYFDAIPASNPQGSTLSADKDVTVNAGESKLVCLDDWSLNNNDPALMITLNANGSLSYSAYSFTGWNAPYWGTAESCYYDVSFNKETGKFEISRRTDAAANSSGTVMPDGQITPPSLVLSLSTDAPDAVVFTNDSADNTITLTAEYDNGTAPTITGWSSSDETIASVSNGVITAVGTGEATVTATDSSNNTATYSVTVKRYVYPDITGINSVLGSINIGGTTQLTAVYENEPAYGAYDVRDVSVIWSISSGSEFASVDVTGKVTGLAEGVATITGTNKNGQSQSVSITVTSASSGGVPEYDAAKAYVAGDCINYNGAYYAAIISVTGYNPDQYATAWVQLSGDPSVTGNYTVGAEGNAYTKGALIQHNGGYFAAITDFTISAGYLDFYLNAQNGYVVAINR